MPFKIMIQTRTLPNRPWMLRASMADVNYAVRHKLKSENEARLEAEKLLTKFQVAFPSIAFRVHEIES